ncbi:MAG: ribonuclease P protein component [Ktedonobacterales bacterium]
MTSSEPPADEAPAEALAAPGEQGQTALTLPAPPSGDGHAEGHAGAHDERLRRTQRLRRASDFQQIRRRSRRLNSAHLTLSYARRATAPAHATASAPVALPAEHSAERPAESEPMRVGFVTSKKIGNAVARNRVRRWLRESVRRQLWHVASGWDMIISARSGAAQSDYQTLDAEVVELLTRARLFARNDNAKSNNAQ